MKLIIHDGIEWRSLQHFMIMNEIDQYGNEKFVYKYVALYSTPASLTNTVKSVCNVNLCNEFYYLCFIQ